MRFRNLVVGCVLFFAFAGSVWGFNAQDLLEDLNKGPADKQLSAAIILKDFIKFPEVVTTLASKLDDTKNDAVLRATCATTLGYSDDKSVYPILQTLAKKPDEKAIVRVACVASMATMRKGDAIPDLVEMLKTEKNGSVRQQIEESLVQMNEAPRVAAAMTPLLKDDATSISAIRVMAAIGGPAVIAPLSKELEEGKPSNRRAIIQSLGSVPNQAAAEALLRFYPKANDAEKVDIIAMLAYHPIPAVVRLLSGELDNEKTFAAIRNRAALSLGQLRAKDAIGSLVRVLLNTAEQQGLRLTCAQALGEFSDHDDQAIAGLIGGLADKRLAEDCSLSLSRMTQRYFGTSKEKWTEWFQNWRENRDKTEHIGH